MSNTFRKIIHIDMDAFFASVEQLDNIELRNKPIAVGGTPGARGVVAAASYEARQFGVRSAMSSFKASQLCQGLVFVRPRISRYREVSRLIHTIFRQYTELVEPLSLDEAYLDVTDSPLYQGSATYIAQAIKRDIKQQTGLTASAGVSYNKFLAKLASDMDKPDGLFVIEPDKALAIIHQLPVNKLFGVGKVTAQKMHTLGIDTIYDLYTTGQANLVQQFGKQGEHYFNLSRGVDNRPVNNNRIRKSIGRETTLSQDMKDIDDIKTVIKSLLADVWQSVNKHKVQAKTITLKIKYYDFSLITRRHTTTHYYTKSAILKQIDSLLMKTEVGHKPVRLVGVSVSNLTTKVDHQVNKHSETAMQKVLF